MDKRKSFSVITLGCFRNTYDSGLIAYDISRRGYYFLPDFYSSNPKKRRIKNCDTILVNTCGFIDKAKEESLEAIKEVINLKRKMKIKKIIVCGCLVERYRNDLEKFFPEVDQWLGVERFTDTFRKRLHIFPSRFSDFLKICEGCLNKCSFCAIPKIKGPLKSRTQEEILKEVRHLDMEGVKELNIIGQDITSWGKDFKDKRNLAGLLRAILEVTKNIRWIRLIYTHPRHFDDSLIELIAKDERICKYIDLPIQHINDRILKAMNRKITKKEIISLISRIRKRIPSGVIRTSVIVGFPGEGKKEFRELLGFLKEIKFERLGAFLYSREEGTPAYNFFPQVHQRTKEKRFNEVMELQKDIAQEVNSRFIGQNLDVLVETKADNTFIGRTQYDALEVDGVVFLKKKNLKPGDFCKTNIIDAYAYDLVGA